MDSVGYWSHIAADQFPVPRDRPLEDLTLDLAGMLGSPDPHQRDDIALGTLIAWIERGVYDDLLAGLGDGLARGLENGLGQVGTDSVFRRSASARVLTVCLDRDRERRLLPPATVLAWGDRIVTWVVRERDLRGWVPEHGWAHAVARGAEALAALARSPHLGPPELTVLLDVVADRVESTTTALVDGEPDRLAAAVLAVLRRGSVPLAVVEPWLMRLADAAALPSPQRVETNPYPGTVNAQAVLRSLHLQIALATTPPPDRADLLLALVEALRRANRALLSPMPVIPTPAPQGDS